MDLLIVAATDLELNIVKNLVESKVKSNTNGLKIEYLISGVGSVSTTYSLTKSFQKSKPDLAIQVGIAGTFDTETKPGKVICIMEEAWGDCGVLEKGKFLSYFDLDLVDPNCPPYKNAKLINTSGGTPEIWQGENITGITVNEITTNQGRIEELKKTYSPSVESLEGAAFFYVCLKENVPFMELRGVSNYIGERDKSKWEISLALENLSKATVEIINTLNI